MKAVSKSVSMSEALWLAVDAHATDMGEDRSDYVRRLVQQDLTAAGKLPGGSMSVIREVAVEAASLMGEQRVLSILNRLKLRAIAGRAKEVA